MVRRSNRKIHYIQREESKVRVLIITRFRITEVEDLLYLLVSEAFSLF